MDLAAYTQDVVNDALKEVKDSNHAVRAVEIILQTVQNL